MKNKKQNRQISTKLVYLDLKTIMENYRKPEFWKTEWTIFESGVFKITWKIRSINVQRNYIESSVQLASCVYQNGPLSLQWACGSYDYKLCRDIPIDHVEYTQQTLNKNILSTTLSLIETVEVRFITQYAEYKEAESQEWSNEEAVKEEARKVVAAFIEEHSLSEDLGEALEDSFVSKFVDNCYDEKRLTHYTTEVLYNYDHKVLGFLYLMVCSWFNSKTQFETEQRKMGDGVKKHLWTKMRREAKKIQKDEWKASMRKEAQELFEEQ